MTMYRELPWIKYEDGSYAAVPHPVVDEVPVSVVVNGRTAATMMTSPTMLRPVGFLLTEGLIRRLDEIKALAVRETSVEVITTNPQRLLFSKKSGLSGCGGTTSFLDTRRLPKVASDLAVSPETIIAAMRDPLSRPPPAHGRAPRRGPRPGERRGRRLGRGHREAQRPRPGDRVRGPERGRERAVLRRCHGPEFVRDGPEVPPRGIPLVASRGATTSLAVSIAEKGGLAISASSGQDG